MARSRASAFKAQQYWVYEAHQREEACDLARQLNLALPNGSPGGNECDIMYPLHRLVITGQDTLPNLHLLFGPASDALAEPHARARQTVLLNARSGLLDDEAPYIRPRKASRAEQDELSRQLQFGKEYRGLLPHCFGGRGISCWRGRRRSRRRRGGISRRWWWSGTAGTAAVTRTAAARDYVDTTRGRGILPQSGWIRRSEERGAELHRTTGEEKKNKRDGSCCILGSMGGINGILAFTKKKKNCVVYNDL
ncbi:hypothetical protein PG993_014914 [Apiospora rasikravindrae]|uniref:Uncharacterized protein n=1 Tax=Apiospora rasikravindrae TaxID=990691 RepID=A0ABR1RP32_9PEZI